MNSLPNWLRWIMAIPAAVVSYIAVNLINHYCSLRYFGGYSDSFEFKTYKIFYESTIAIGVFLYVLYQVIPSHKITASIASAIIIGIISIISLTLHLTNPYTIIPLWETLTAVTLTIGSCIYFCVVISKNKNDINTQTKG